MLAATLFYVIATLGNSAFAAPVDDTNSIGPNGRYKQSQQFPAFGNSTLERRAPNFNVPKESGMAYWEDYEDGSLIGTLPGEWQAPSPFANCKAVEYGHTKDRYGLGDALDVKVRCLLWSKQTAWDIRRIGDVTYCNHGSVSEKWTIGEKETTEVSAGMDLGASGIFEIFSASLNFKVTNTVEKSKGYEKSVTCGDFKGIKCRVGGHAVAEIGYFEGWVNVPKGDDISKWQAQTNEEPYNMRDFKKTTAHAWNQGYETGWIDWETEGEDRCRNDFKDRHYLASKI